MNDRFDVEHAPHRLLVLVPHYDDEVLGCGGTLAKLAGRSNIRLIYATSGRGSEDLGMPGVRVNPSLDLGEIRRRESLRALSVLGIGEHAADFLDVPDYQVAQFHQSVYERIVRLGRDFGPDAIWLPFRYDRHPDHVALSRIGFSAATVLGVRDVWEYFVYYRWKLLPGGDVRRYLRPEWLVESHLNGTAERKRVALECFATQTTLFFSWQVRPVLSAELIDEVCSTPEMFLRAGHAPDTEIFAAPLPLIRFVHAVEPRIKKRLDQLRFLLRSCAARRREKADTLSRPAGAMPDGR